MGLEAVVSFCYDEKENLHTCVVYIIPIFGFNIHNSIHIFIYTTVHSNVWVLCFFSGLSLFVS